jgi:Domain of Unknown Function (DUF1080)
MPRPWFLLALLALTLPASADDESGFQSLFNGKDLTGWRLGKESLDGKLATADSRFKVENGVLVITGPTKPGDPAKLEIDTAAALDGDLVIRLEFKASRDANSGLHLRDHAFPHQLQIRDYPRVGPYKTLKHYKSDGWNALEVTIKTAADGKTAVAHCTCNGELLEDALPIPATGPIGLQSETNVLEFKAIRVRHLSRVSKP